jgi:hypothetical protein
LGQIVSLIGSNMRYVAVPWQVFQITHSTVAVGLVGLVEVVPLILLSLYTGALADRLDRKKLVIWSQVGLMCSALVLAYVTLQGDPSLAWIYLLTGISSAFNAIDRPARGAMMPTLVGEDKLAAAVALRQVVFQITAIVGPLIGGLLIAVFDVGWVYVVDAATFLAALYSLRWVPSIRGHDMHDETTWTSVKEGFRFVTRTPLILSILVIDLVAMIFGMPRAVFPALAEEIFGMGAGGVGLLYSSISIGALIGALTTGWVSGVRRQGIAVLVAVAAWGTAITLAGVVAKYSILLTMVFLAAAGWADVISAVFRGTMLLDNTPDILRGRANAVNLMVVTGGPRLGDIEAGLAAAAFGVLPSIVLGGLACLLGTAIVGLAFPQMRSYKATTRGTAPERDPEAA